MLIECRRAREIEPGGVNAPDPINLVDCRQTLHGFNGLGRLGAIIVFDQLDLARPVLGLNPAALVIDLMRP